MTSSERAWGTMMPRVDRGALDALIEVIGAESVQGFLLEFQASAAQHRFSIQAAMEDGDFDALYHEAHNLVSTSGNLGIKRTSALADDVQQAARRHDHEALEPAVEALLIELDAVVDHLPGLMEAASNVV